jgi:phosphoglycolate phosphatase
MAVLTNKPVGFSTRIIERLELSDHFFRIYGGNSFDSKKPDPEGLNLIMAEGRSVAAATAMIGDSSVDVLTARNAGVLAAGVTYGLRPESFNEHPPDILCDTIEEVAAALDRVGPQAGFASLGRIPG